MVVSRLWRWYGAFYSYEDDDKMETKVVIEFEAEYLCLLEIFPVMM